MADPGSLGALEQSFTLADGGRIVVRPIRPDDKDALRDAFGRLSMESRRLRFLQGKDELTKAQLEYLTEIDYHDHFAWVATSRPSPNTEVGVGVARYIRIATGSDVAEPAVAVSDEDQGRGIGRILFSLLSETAVEHGIATFRVYVSAANARLLRSLEAIASVEVFEGTAARLDLPLPLDRELLTESAPYEVLRGVAARTLRPVLPPNGDVA